MFPSEYKRLFYVVWGHIGNERGACGYITIDSDYCYGTPLSHEEHQKIVAKVEEAERWGMDTHNVIPIVWSHTELRIT